MRQSGVERRITGRKLQARRLRIWSRDPHCARCRQLTDYPHGFQLDHKVALVNGGQDVDGNCQVLCEQCHVIKTGKDMGHRERIEFGADGMPIDPAHPWNAS